MSRASTRPTRAASSSSAGTSPARSFEACPNAEWRLLFALSRSGGLRCPSEHFALTWADVDWGRGRFLVRSTKTEHHDGKGERWVAIFPELRPHLEEAFELAAEGDACVFPHRRDAGANLRTRLLKIIRRAGLTPWPKLLHNLRASGETELAAVYPLHVVCAWIGNSQRIAAKHYLQVTEDYFQLAAAGDGAGGGANSGAEVAQKAARQPAAPDRTGLQGGRESLENQAFLRDGESTCETVQVGDYPWRDSNPRPAD
jgi:hypothetical protein